jgi:quinoprotein glucose dehydrogenase
MLHGESARCHVRTLLVTCCVALLTLGAALIAQRGPADVEWRHYSGDNGSTKYSPLAQITKDNVARLRIAWRRPAVDPAVLERNPKLRPANNFRSTPIMVGGLLYASNGIGLVEAFNAASGATVWVQQVPESELASSGTANRGVAYWGQGGNGRILTFRNQYLYALDARSGMPVADFGDAGRVDLTAATGASRPYSWNGTPLIVKDVVVLGSSMADQDSAARMTGVPGNVYGFDVRTGRLRWTFSPIPKAGEPGVETWENESWRYTGAANVWAPMSADDELGYVYLPTSSATNDMYGGHRLGANLFSSSIVCLDAATGKRVWHFQTVHHDLFDYDNPAAPILADITVNGRRVKAVVQVTKQAFAFVLDRVTGQPVWPIEERPVAASTVPGERAWPTQPVPSKPPAFDQQGLTVDDLIDFTPELRAQALEITKKYVIGAMFTPPSVAGPGADDKKGTIQMPGSVGGADWTGAAFDRETGVLYVPSMTNPFVANLLPGDPQRTDLRFRASTRELIQGPGGLPLTKPPYGRITALDLNRGEKKWMVANGDGPRNHPLIRHLNLPPLGQAVRAAPLVTRTLLFVSEGDQVNVRTPPEGGGRKLRAFDKASGKVVWETELPAGTTGTLMTYQFNGLQHIVVAIGGQNHPPEFVAFAIKEN